MKIPQKAPGIEEIFAKHSKEVSKLFGDTETQKKISEYNSRYLHWDEIRRREENPEVIWMLIKMFRGNQQKTLKFNKWTFKYSLTNECLKQLHILDKNAAGNIESGIDSTSSGKERYIISSLMEEAIASSQLEGAATTRVRAKEMLRLNKKPSTDSEQMIVNGYRTIQKIVQMKDKKITPQMLIEIQKEITKNTLKNSADEGKFRDNNDVVVGDPVDHGVIYYVPPDYEEIPRLIDAFCEFASNDDEEFIHPIVKGIMLHFLIGYIHPFNDGNGRTARAIFYWYALTRGYWLFEYMAISRIILRSKADYALAYLYTEKDDNDLTYFINYNLKSIGEALEDMQKYISRKQKEQKEASQLLKNNKDLNFRQAQMLKEFIKNESKVSTIQEFMNIFNVVYQTARSDLLYLEKKGYLEKVKAGKQFYFKLKKNVNNQHGF